MKPHGTRLIDDNQGVLGYILAIVLGAALISSVIVMGIGTSTSNQSTDASSNVDSVQDGVSSGLDETNDILINDNTDGVTLSSSSVSWEGLDDVGKNNIGALLSSIQNQQKTTGKFTKVEPAGAEGVNDGAYLKQWEAGEYSTTTEYTEYHDVDHTHSSNHVHETQHTHTYEESHTDYDYTHTHSEEETRYSYDYIHTHTDYERNGCHQQGGFDGNGCQTSDKRESHVHEEWQSGRWHEHSTTHTHTRRTSTPHTHYSDHTHYNSHWGWHSAWQCSGGGTGFCNHIHSSNHRHSSTHWHYEEETYTETHTSDHWHDGYYDSETYYHGYDKVTSNHRHDNPCSGCDQVVDYTYTETVYTDHVHDNYCTGCDRFAAGTYTHEHEYTETHYSDHTHYSNHVHEDEEEHTHTRTETVQGGSFTYDGQNDWVAMDDVSEYRESSITVTSAGLADHEENAFQLNADSWTMKVWNNNGGIHVETSDGFNNTYSGDSITINPAAGTVERDSIDFGGGNEGYELSVVNGQNAFGHYTLVSDGDLVDPSDDLTQDTDSQQGSITVADDIVYSATLDVTYESGSTTVTNRMSVEPAVTAEEKP